jgi:hypothetical protein
MLRATVSTGRAPSSVTARVAPLQRKCACGGTPGPTGECEECRKKRLQRKASNSEVKTRNDSPVPPIVHEVLRSPGRPLDPAVGAFMESRFGHDFSQVRVHTDARAAESARAVNALAYTVGTNVVFAAQQYSPREALGRQLLAHELAHVVQQGVAHPPITGDFPVSSPDHPAEREADAVANAVNALTYTIGANVSIAPPSIAPPIPGRDPSRRSSDSPRRPLSALTSPDPLPSSGLSKEKAAAVPSSTTIWLMRRTRPRTRTSTSRVCPLTSLSRY